MPGEEQEDIVMTSNQCNILNVTCPLSGKPITELQHPVRRCCMSYFKILYFSLFGEFECMVFTEC